MKDNKVGPTSDKKSPIASDSMRGPKSRAAQASMGKSSITDISMVRANKNPSLLYGRLDATLIGTDALDAHNKDLLAVTKDFNMLLK